MFTVSGVVVHEDGMPAASSFVTLSSTNDSVDSMLSFPITAAESNGHFSLKHVLPGSYTIQAQGVEDEQHKNVVMARQKIEVGQEDINNLHLVLGKGLTITGKITAAGSPLPKISDMILSLSSTDGLGQGGWAEIAKDGTLKVSGISPGTYKVQIGGLPEQYYL